MSRTIRAAVGRNDEALWVDACIARDLRALRLRTAALRRQPTIAEKLAGPATTSRGLLARIFGR